MFNNYCCCCFKPTEYLLSIKTKSSHEDGKTLLDYFNCMFPEHKVSDLICARCSKALQVSYHFINMVSKTRKSQAVAQINNDNNKDEHLFLPEMWHKIQHRQNIPLNENWLKFASNSEKSSQHAPTFHLASDFDMFSGFNTDAESSIIAEEYKLNFICNICNMSFDDETCLEEHNRQKHKEIIPYKCKLCSFYTCYAESLFKHCEKNHGLKNVVLDLYQRKEETVYSCVLCNFENPVRAAIDEHLVNEHSVEDDRETFVKNLFICPACCRSFNSLKSAKIHYSMYHICASKKNNVCETTKFRCEKCGKIFDLKSGLSMHMLICEQRIVSCNFCNVEFTSVLKYERHLQDTHFVAIKHECEICSKTFNSSEYLAVHRRRHNERNIQCDLCPKNYIYNAELKVHKQRIHGIKFANLTLF